MSDNEILVNRIRIGKDQLSAIPDDERSFLFMLGHIGNELSILQKLQWYASNYEYPTETVEDHVHTSQALLVAKLLVAKEKEAWNFIRTIFLSTPLGKIYVPLLTSDAQAALDSLKAYFGKGTFIDNVRNEFVFHYLTDGWSDRLTAVYNKIEEGECVFYVSKSRANTHWYGAEVVVNYALLETVQVGEPAEAMDRLIDESLNVVAWLTTFVDHCIVAIVQKHLGFEFVEKQTEPITIRNAPDPRNVSIPFFVQVPEQF